jgi:hypothetical protein
MTRLERQRALCLTLLFTQACQVASVADDEDTTGTTSGEGTTGETGGTGDTGEGDDGASCVPEITDDCMDPNLKCMPWSEAMGPPQDHQCCPLDPSPVALGERCHTQDHVHSCIDDCPAGSMCMVDDIDALAGYCHEFCEIADPEACGLEAVCMPLFSTTEAITPLCLLRCDPLLQDCDAHDRTGWTCIPTGPFDPDFICLPPTGPVPRLEYEACVIPSDCATGLMCVPASQMLGCEAERCCTPICDVSEQPSSCTMGNECISLDSDIPGAENVGICLDPAA